MKKLLSLITIVLITLSLGCISGKTTQTVTVTTTVERMLMTTVTATTTLMEQVTTTVTATSTLMEQVTTTTTTTETTTVTTTVTLPAGAPAASPLTYDVVVTPYSGPLSTTLNGTTMTVYIPSSWSPVANDIYNLYRFFNPQYLSYISSIISKELGITRIPAGHDMTDYETIASVMYFSFAYDYERAENPPLISYLPHQLLEKHSGICGDYALFYAALLLAHSKTVTYYVLSFDNGDGHAMIEYDGVIWEDEYVGEAPEYALDYWFKEKGPYHLYAITIRPDGSIDYSSTYISTLTPLPLTPAFMTSTIVLTGALTYTYAGAIITENVSVNYNQTRGTITHVIKAEYTTVTLYYSYNYPSIYYSSGTYWTVINLTGTDDVRKYFILPPYIPRYDVFYENGNTLYMLYWNTENEPEYYTVVVDQNTLLITHTGTISGAILVATGTVELQ